MLNVLAIALLLHDLQLVFSWFDRSIKALIFKFSVGRWNSTSARKIRMQHATGQKKFGQCTQTARQSNQQCQKSHYRGSSHSDACDGINNSRSPSIHLALKGVPVRAILSCSNMTKQTICHGPNRIQAGKNPLYSAPTPSWRTVFTRQSSGPL